MPSRARLEQLKLEQEILTHVHHAVGIAVSAPIDQEKGETWRDRIAFLLESYCRHVRRVFSIEEEGGYMDVILDGARPNLAARVEILRLEHRQLQEQIEHLIVQARNARPENLANLHELRQRVGEWLRRFDAHLKSERDLFMDAFLVDIGGEGG